MISRFIALLLVGAALIVAASFLHIIGMAYLVGVLSGLLLGMVMWLRFSQQGKRKGASSKHVTISLEHAAGAMKFDGDIAEGLFLAARHLTGQERLELIARLQAHHAEFEAAGR